MSEHSPFAEIKSQLDTIPDGVPVVFISYSWDNEEHKNWVFMLSRDLREKYRVYTLLDRYNLGGEDLTAFMKKGLQRADRVLIIGTPKYLEKVENSIGCGVKFEDQVITISLCKDMDSQKFIPILREGSFSESFNLLIGNRVGYDLSNDVHYEEVLNDLAADIWGVPMNQAPLLGPKPNFTPASQVLQPTIVESPKDFAILVKRYLPDPSKRVLFDEIVENETNKAYKKISQHAKYSMPLSESMFLKYDGIHQEAISSLLQVVVPIVRYGTMEQAKLLIDAMIKLCKKSFVNGEITCEGTSKIHFIAATYLFHSMGTACIKYERFDIIHLLISAKVNPPHPYSCNYSCSLQYLAGCNHIDTIELNQYMRSNWNYPYSFMVLNGIRQAFVEIFFNEDDFKNTFFAWEHLASLLCRYYENCTLQSDWNPLGHFLYKRISLRRNEEDFYTDFFKAAEELKDEWQPLKFGLFGGRYENYLKTYRASEEFYKSYFHY